MSSEPKRTESEAVGAILEAARADALEAKSGAMSEAEKSAFLEAQGVDKAERAALLARQVLRIEAALATQALETAQPPKARVTPKEAPPRRRGVVRDLFAGMVGFAAAATLGLVLANAGLLVAVTGPTPTEAPPVSTSAPTKAPPLSTGASPPPPQVMAEWYRRDAYRACGHEQWQACIDALDEAKRFDGSPEDADAVSARARAQRGLHAAGDGG